MYLTVSLSSTYRFVLEAEFRTPFGEIISLNRTKLVAHILVRWTVVKSHVLINHFIILVPTGGRSLCNRKQ